MNPVLYILMRNDVASLTVGRQMAQASHAASAIASRMERLGRQIPENRNIGVNRTIAYECWLDWVRSTRQTSIVSPNNYSQGFGTTIVLSVSEKEMRDTIAVALVARSQEKSFTAGIITDPTYAVKDGDIAHIVSLDTCGYILGDRDSEALKLLTQDFKLAGEDTPPWREV
jgi:hypothetical protein|tara:strand:- start:107 stop:619 length:513 start_codon:yes stop_codon:yes gene_type:complete